MVTATMLCTASLSAVSVTVAFGTKTSAAAATTVSAARLTSAPKTMRSGLARLKKRFSDDE